MNTNAIIWILIFLFGILFLYSFLGIINDKNQFMYSSFNEGFTSVASSTTDLSGNVLDISANSYDITNIMALGANSGSTAGTNTNYDNYNHFSKTSSTPAIINGTTFYGPNGNTAQFYTTPNGTQIIKVTVGSNITIYTVSKTSVTQFTGANGGSAILVQKDGETQLVVTLPNGTVIYFTTTPPPYQSQSMTATDTNTSSSGGMSNYNTAYYGSTGTIPPSGSYMGYTGGNTPPPAPTPASSYPPPTSSSSMTTPYSSSQGMGGVDTLGIPKSQIPPGQEDLYILKTQALTPICPACPPVINTCKKENGDACPPCKPCGRCPDTSSTTLYPFPNYSALNSSSMPVPVLNDFSGFGL